MRISAALFLLFFFASQASAFCFEEAGSEYGISPVVLWSIAKHESNLNPGAICRNRNGSYDYGLMQINSRWAKVLGEERWMSLGNPCVNVRTGAWILSQCIRRHGYNWKAVGCYHSSTPGRRERYASHIAAAIKKVVPDVFIEPRPDTSPAILSVSRDGASDPWHDAFGSAL